MRFLKVDGFAPPRGAYSHGAHIPAGTPEIVFVSGQVALRRDGSVPDGIEAQTALVWDKIGRVLAEAGMTVADIAKVSTFLVSHEHLAGFSAARDRCLGPHRPAATLVIVQGLANPAYLVEIEVVAVRSTGQPVTAS